MNDLQQAKEHVQMMVNYHLENASHGDNVSAQDYAALTCILARLDQYERLEADALAADDIPDGPGLTVKQQKQVRELKDEVSKLQAEVELWSGEARSNLDNGIALIKQEQAEVARLKEQVEDLSKIARDAIDMLANVPTFAPDSYKSGQLSVQRHLQERLREALDNGGENYER